MRQTNVQVRDLEEDRSKVISGMRDPIFPMRPSGDTSRDMTDLPRSTRFMQHTALSYPMQGKHASNVASQSKDHSHGLYVTNMGEIVEIAIRIDTRNQSGRLIHPRLIHSDVGQIIVVLKGASPLYRGFHGTDSHTELWLVSRLFRGPSRR